jgi:hypothetical protein
MNYDHVLYRAVRATLDANDALIRNLRKSLNEWTPEPISGVLFGSAARRDGSIRSDIDLLLIRPSSMGHSTLEREWARQVHALRGDVFHWTGNHLQTIDWTESALRRHRARGEALIDGILRDGITIAGTSLLGLLERDAKPRSLRQPLR